MTNNKFRNAEIHFVIWDLSFVIREEPKASPAGELRSLPHPGRLTGCFENRKPEIPFGLNSAPAMGNEIKWNVNE